MKTKHNAKKLAKNLLKEGIESDSLHGNLRQNKRNQVIAKFRANKLHVLVATDIAARGLDIPHIEHVINYDLPQQAEDFIHRMGRTGRAGASGTAWSYVTPSDKKKWYEIEKILNPGLKSLSEQKSDVRRDNFERKQSFHKRKHRGGKFNFRDRNKNNFRDNKPFNKKENEFRAERTEGFKSKPKNEGYGRKNKSSFGDRPRREGGFQDRREGFQSRSKQHHSRDRNSSFAQKSNRGNKFRAMNRDGFKSRNKNFSKKSLALIIK